MRTGRGAVGDGGSCVCNKNTWLKSVEVIIFLPTDQNRISFFFSFAGWDRCSVVLFSPCQNVRVGSCVG